VLLAGDAAHVHYPAGGQGLNFDAGVVICRALQKLSTPRRLCWAMAVPIWPMDAPITAAGMLSKEF
jgi:hypothetical protein